MYFVDRDKIEDKLRFIDHQVGLFQAQQQWNTDFEKAALERIIHMTIEALLDVGNAMIDGFIMRDPGSYEDIIDILEDEKVITREMSVGYKRIIAYRKNLQQFYTNINHSELVGAFDKELPVLKSFTSHVRKYLESAMGVVTAFMPN
ncbi:DUF86 domain-containing protein [Niallia sp. XMNu-256]|uniref:DUF86 domain-containing protein n=1 Tax=Niallia sp. XMNu-256 TaxID=3082444 RepID=UPI0030D5509F